jgi:hypothetical protein
MARWTYTTRNRHVFIKESSKVVVGITDVKELKVQ